MRVLTPLLISALVYGLAGRAPAHAQGFPDQPSRKSAIKCQKALLGATARFFAKELSILAKCNGKALDCVHQPDPEKRDECLQKGNSCRAALQSVLAKADNELGGKIGKDCGRLTKDQLLGAEGLGYALVDPECLSIGSELVDVSSITGCLRKVYRRSIERLFAIESPRTRELFQKTGIDIGSLPDLPGYPSCDGCSVTADAKTAKQLTKCAKSITNAGRAFAATAASLVSKCALALFECEQSPKPLSPAQAEVCRAAAQLQCEKAKTKAVEAQGKVRVKVGKACAPLPAGILTSQEGVNIKTLACECTAVNIDQVQNLEQYLACSRLHHECRVAQLLRFAIPRLDELLTNTKTTARLEDILCKIPPDPETLETANRALGGCRICRFLSAIRARFNRGTGFSPIVKFAVLKQGGARKAARGLSPDAGRASAPPATITNIEGDRTYEPSSSRQITVGYQLTGAAATAPRVENPPKLLIAVERLDGSLVANDAFELELEPDISATDLTVAYSAAAPDETGCSFRLVFGIANGDSTEFTPFDLQRGTCQRNGRTDPGEDCDPDAPGSVNCDNNCTFSRCGNGVVTSGEVCDDGNLDEGDGCPADCGANGTPATVTPTPAGGSTATRTATPATPAPTATPTPTTPPTVTPTRTATRTPTVTPTPNRLLTVVKSGTGTGTVTSVPGGIDCGATCSATYTTGQMIQLRARTTNGSNSYFQGWSGGGCSTFRDCTVTMDAAKTVTATFAAQTFNTVFVSSQDYPNNLGGTAPYDTACNDLATGAGINTNSGSAYVAWLSDSNSKAGDRLGSARGFVRLDGRAFADDVGSLTSQNEVLNPVRFDERGAETGIIVTGVTAYYRTGTNVDGTPSSFNCNDWTSVAAADRVTAGESLGGPKEWTSSVGAFCDTPRRLLCMMNTKNAAISPPSNAGKKIYLTNTPYIVGSTTPDAKCEAEKPSGTGTVKALLAKTTAPAAAVVNPAATYVRPDGEIVATGAELLAGGDTQHGRLQSGIWQTAAGNYPIDFDKVWTGHTNVTAVGTAFSTCADWTDQNLPSGQIGDKETAEFFWWQSLTLPCNDMRVRLYCIEQ